MMDIHLHEGIQEECPEEENIDMHHYLRKQFKKSEGGNTKYDFFMEIRPTQLPVQKPLFYAKVRYIEQMIKFFGRHFKMSEKMDKILQSPTLPHVRFHYIDPRDYFSIYSGLSSIAWIDFYDSMNQLPYSGATMRQLSALIMDTEKNAKEWSELLAEPSKLKADTHQPVFKITVERMTPDELILIKKHLVYKIFEKYNKKEVKNKIHQVTIEHVIPILDKLQEALQKLSKLVTKYKIIIISPPNLLVQDAHGKYDYGLTSRDKLNFAMDIYENFLECKDLVISFQARLMDLFFLRRFLDKDYITNGIAYTGENHSEFYIFVLVKYFDFQITHTSYSKEPVDKLTQIIKDIPNTNEMIPIFNPPILSQCVHTHNFPKQFQ